MLLRWDIAKGVVCTCFFDHTTRNTMTPRANLHAVLQIALQYSSYNFLITAFRGGVIGHGEWNTWNTGNWLCIFTISSFFCNGGDSWFLPGNLLAAAYAWEPCVSSSGSPPPTWAWIFIIVVSSVFICVIKSSLFIYICILISTGGALRLPTTYKNDL